jgi:branched-chain amino acid transport system permease protein
LIGLRWRGWIAAATAFAALATLPLWLANSFYINVASQILFWAIFAQALNVLAGYAGLTSLGHAALFAMSGYTAALLLAAGHSHLLATCAGLLSAVLTSAVFAVLALRAAGIGFLMITLALGQIVWGIAYRWAALTNGDNGVSVESRPMPFGLDLTSPAGFYWVTFCIFILAILTMAVFVRSPFGATLCGTRDQPRRMNALGYNVWLIRFLAFLFSGFWTGAAGLLFVYYNQFISPQIAAIQTSAEALLMVIAGGTATVLGPVAGAAIVVIMKNVASAYIERWNLVLGVIFVLIVSFMPEGLIPGSVRLAQRVRRALRGQSSAPARSTAAGLVTRAGERRGGTP